MGFIEAFDIGQFQDTIVSYLTAFVCGTLIGVERQLRQRSAGLRTYVLVAMGAAGFVDLAQDVAGNVEAVRVISYVVSGIGFLGAGVIMKEGLNVRGLNTAATLWCAAAVGSAAGVDKIAEAALLTVFVIACNTLLRPLVNAINRVPTDSKSVEATYVVTVAGPAARVDEIRDMLRGHLGVAKYPVAEIVVAERGNDEVEIAATLTSTEAKAADLDAVIARLRGDPRVAHAAWSANTQ